MKTVSFISTVACVLHVAALAGAEEGSASVPAAGETTTTAAAVETAPPTASGSSDAAGGPSSLADEGAGEDTAGTTKRDKSAALYLNPLGLIFGMILGEADITLAPHVALTLEGSYWNTEIAGIDNTAWGLGAGVRYYFKKKLYRGWYVAPVIQFAQAEATATDFYGTTYSAEATLVGLKASVGHQWLWDPFTLRVGAGLGYFSAVGEDSAGTTRVELAGVSPVLEGALGFAF